MDSLRTFRCVPVLWKNLPAHTDNIPRYSSSSMVDRVCHSGRRECLLDSAGEADGLADDETVVEVETTLCSSSGSASSLMDAREDAVLCSLRRLCTARRAAATAAARTDWFADCDASGGGCEELRWREKACCGLEGAVLGRGAAVTSTYTSSRIGRMVVAVMVWQMGPRVNDRLKGRARVAK